MKGTRFKKVLRENLGNIFREFRIAATPVPTPKKWVFIVGCYNSGTTLLADVLGHHPSISALPTEGHFITDQFIKDYDIGLPRMWVEREDIFRLNENDIGPDVIRIKKEWGMRLDLSKPVLLEKSPPNSAKTRWLQKHFENAYFIGIVRNGYAVAEGIKRKGNPQHIASGWPIEMTAKQWARSNQILIEDAKHLQKFMWIKYEEITENAQSALNKITDFIEISPMNLDENKSWSVHERNDEIRNMNTDSIKKLTSDEIIKINEIAGGILDYFNYQRL